MGNSLKLNAKFFVRTIAAIAVCANFSSIAFAGNTPGQTLTTAPDFFNSANIQNTPAHSVADLNKIFVTGIGPFDSNTMPGNIYPYNLPQNGVFNNPLYNGCYDSKNGRLGNLDADLSCTSTIAAHPGISVFRLFLGYKIDCAEANPVGGICNDTSILLNCEYKQVKVGTGMFDNQIATRMCSKGNPIIRRAKASTNTTPALIGCLPGQNGTIYPGCPACNDGEYNSVIGANTSACIKCTAADVTGGAQTPADQKGYLFANSLPTTFTTHTASGAAAGAVSSSQCQIASGDGWTCMNKYTKTTDNQHCEPITSCPISLNTVSKNPTAIGVTNGSITAYYSKTVGALTAFNITAPTATTPQGPTSTDTASGTFTNLGANTPYTITVSDANCTTSTQVTLTDPTSLAQWDPVVQKTLCPDGTTKHAWSNCLPGPVSEVNPICKAGDTKDISPPISCPGACDINPLDPNLIQSSCTCGPGYTRSSKPTVFIPIAQ